MDLNDFAEKETIKNNPLRNDILNIIKNANDKELKIFFDILNPLKKNLDNFKE